MLKQKRIALLSLVCAMILIVTLSLATIALLNTSQPGSAIHTTSTSNHIITPMIATPTVMVDAQTLRNRKMGCAQGKPAPVPGLLVNGVNHANKAPPPKEVALTFDDGPTSYSTPDVLAVLEKMQIPATFFVEGNFARNWPNLLSREWNDGFAIGLHSWDHPFMNTLNDQQLKHQFGDTLTAVHKVIGDNACLWFWRPPYGVVTTHILKTAQTYGLTTINWDDAGLDWTRPGAQQIANNVFRLVHPGAIILLHDGPAAREQTAQAIPLIIAGLQARGLVPVTIPQLLADNQFYDAGGAFSEASTPTPRDQSDR